MLKEKIKKDLEAAAEKVLGREPEGGKLERPRNLEHGDYSSNSALVEFESQAPDFKSPLGLAREIVKVLPEREYLEKTEVAPPGFINFYLTLSPFQEEVGEIVKEGKKYGGGEKKEEKIQVEYISANPTGPLHVGNCRGGFAGDTLANVLEKRGYEVKREYYINDRGRQIERLARSVKARWSELEGQKVKFPEDGYRGAYVEEIAKEFRKENLEPTSQNFREFSLNSILGRIKETVARMEIEYDCWFSEKSLYERGTVDKVLKVLRKKDFLFKKEGALWFKSKSFGDEKNRVLVKSNGDPTYFLSDIAYHYDKFEQRNFDKVILYWGADHHGYVKRLMGAIDALGFEGQAEVELTQMLALRRGKERVKMSKRDGCFLTIDELLDEIGLDAARFHFLLHGLDKPMTLDLKKAAQNSKDNPVYYVQYAHARISSILKKVKQKEKRSDLDLLTRPAEISLIKQLSYFPVLLNRLEENRKLQALPTYTMKTADLFHKFYEKCRVKGKDKRLQSARVVLLKATRTILRQSLSLMGVEAPEEM